MLAYPSFALLKANLPNVTVYALVPSYTRALAEACPWIDRLLIDPSPQGRWPSGYRLAKAIRDERIDGVISLYSTARVGIAVYLAGIPYRLAPATKFAQVFYNYRLVQRRSCSEKPEYVYNQELVRHFLRTQPVTIRYEPTPPFLRFNDDHVSRLKARFCQSHGIEPDRPLIFVHPGSGGSARNLSLDQFARLVRKLESKEGHHVVISAGPMEREPAAKLSDLLAQRPHTIYHSTQGLRIFAEHIQFADLFISGSTGPLHIAGALDVPTAAFYPKRRSSTALRWQTLNTPGNRLSFSPKDSADPEDMQAVDIDSAAKTISEHLLWRRD
ncbi:MAG: glycosyltransferase family 9 protein [Nitrospiria bacterium]